jgi:anti-sigma-K factor RskA
MAELKELFEMVTNKVEPDLDAWQEQDERRQQRHRRRRGAAFAVAAVIATLAVVAAFALRNTSTREPLTSPAPTLSTTTALVAFEVATGDATPIRCRCVARRRAHRLRPQRQGSWRDLHRRHRRISG